MLYLVVQGRAIGIATTNKILKLELKKVRYIRSLSFVQGTFVNLLRKPSCS